MRHAIWPIQLQAHFLYGRLHHLKNLLSRVLAAAALVALIKLSPVARSHGSVAVRAECQLLLELLLVLIDLDQFCLVDVCLHDAGRSQVPGADELDLQLLLKTRVAAPDGIVALVNAALAHVLVARFVHRVPMLVVHVAIMTVLADISHDLARLRNLCSERAAHVVLLVVKFVSSFFIIAVELVGVLTITSFCVLIISWEGLIHVPAVQILNIIFNIKKLVLVFIL